MNAFKHLLSQCNGLLHSGSNNFIELFPGNFHININSVLVTVFQNPQYLDIRLMLGTQADFGLFNLIFQLSDKAVFTFPILIFDEFRYILYIIFFRCFSQNIFSEHSVNILAAKPHVPAFAHFEELPPADCQHGQVKGAAAEIKDKNGLGLIASDSIHPKGNGCRGRFGKQPANL